MHTTLLTKPARYMLLTWVTVLLGVAMSAALMLIGSPLPARAQGTIYVDADAPGPAHDGLSWSTAYTTVQEALVAAASGDEIWVAQGVYYPDEGVGQTDNVLTSTFALTTGVALYGGFDPGVDADEWSERDWETYLTVLSGDLEQNDVTDPHGVVTDTDNIVGNNAYHVVTGSATDDSAVLDGFIISGGYAHYSLNHNDPHNSGGGMYNDGGHPTLRNLTFSGNSAHSYGGGMENVNHSNPILTHVIFQANAAGSGGGMDNYHSDPTLTYVTFSANTATFGGGGMYNSESSPTLVNVIFAGNTAGDYGGGMCNEYYNPTLTNVIFAGNSALTYDGGGIFNYDSSPTLTQVTFSGNSAHRQGGGIGNNETSLPAVRNSILWGNIPDQISNDATVSYSLVQGAAVYTGTGNINSDPLFVDADGVDNVFGTADDDLHLRTLSPACDAGHNDALPVDGLDLDDDGDTTEKLPVDLDGKPRFFDNPVVPDTGNGMPPLVDMGAYEAVSSILTLRKSVTPTQAVRYHGAVTYSLSLHNTGLLSDSVTLTDTLPDGAIFGSWVISPTGTLRSGNAITWTGAISAGESVTATFTAIHSGDYGDVITNTARFSGTQQTGSAAVKFQVIPAYVITPKAGAGGSITPDTPQTVPHGSDLVFTIAPAAGYHISDVGVDGVSVGVTTTYTFGNVTADHTLSAAFALNTYIITPTVGAGGSISPTTPQTVSHGDDITFTITSDTGYHVSDVTVDGGSVGAVSAYTFTDVITHHTLSAAFALNTYIITPTVGAGGSISPTTPQTVSHGDDITFTITPDTGYHVADVLVDGGSVGAVSAYTFTDVITHHTLSAAFALNEYTLNINSVGSGSATRVPSQTIYLYGDVVTLTAAADPEWYFGQWSGDASGTLTQTAVTMTADKVVTATFVAAPPTYYTLTMSIVGSGVITPAAGIHSYLSGTLVSVSASPMEGWQFDGWSGGLESAANPAQLTMGADKAVTATFSLSSANHAPTADAGADQYAIQGDVVTLDGSGSRDPDVGDSLTYSWAQTGGPAITLMPGATISVTTFAAPSQPTLLTFTLTVTDSLGLSASDATVITVGPHRIYLPLVSRY